MSYLIRDITHYALYKFYNLLTYLQQQLFPVIYRHVYDNALIESFSFLLICCLATYGVLSHSTKTQLVSKPRHI